MIVVVELHNAERHSTRLSRCSVCALEFFTITWVGTLRSQTATSATSTMTKGPSTSSIQIIMGAGLGAACVLLANDRTNPFKRYFFRHCAGCGQPKRTNNLGVHSFLS